MSDALRDTEFKVFGGTIAGGGVVKGLNAGSGTCRAPPWTG